MTGYVAHTFSVTSCGKRAELLVTGVQASMWEMASDGAGRRMEK